MNKTIQAKESAFSRLVAFEVLSIMASLFFLVLAVLLLIMPALALFGVDVPNDSVVAMAHGSIASAVGSATFWITWVFLKRFHAKVYQDLLNSYKEQNNAA